MNYKKAEYESALESARSALFKIQQNWKYEAYPRSKEKRLLAEIADLEKKISQL